MDRDITLAANLRRVDLNLLNIFSVLSVENNLTLTAKQLNMTQPAVSMALQRLRTLYNDPLFVRKGRAMEPTIKAKALKQEIDKALMIIRETLPDDSSFIPATAKHNFKVNVFSFAEQLFVSKFIEQLAVEAPNCKLTISTDYKQGPEKRLRNRELDVHLNYEAIDNPDFHSILISSEKLVIAARKDHTRLKNKKTLTIDDFSNEQHAVYTSNENVDLFDKVFLKDTYLPESKRNIVYYGSSEIGVMTLVASTDIITLVPESLVYLLSDVCDFICFPPPFACHSFDIYLTWYSGHEHEPQHRWFREFIVSSSQALAEDIKQKIK